MHCFHFMLCFFLLLLYQLNDFCAASISFMFLSATPLAILSLPSSRKAQTDWSISSAFDSLSSSSLMLSWDQQFSSCPLFSFSLLHFPAVFLQKIFSFMNLHSFFLLLHVPSIPCENCSLILACPCSLLSPPSFLTPPSTALNPFNAVIDKLLSLDNVLSFINKLFSLSALPWERLSAHLITFPSTLNFWLTDTLFNFSTLLQYWPTLTVEPSFCAHSSGISVSA